MAHGLSCSAAWNLPESGIKPLSPALTGGFLPPSHQGSPGDVQQSYLAIVISRAETHFRYLLGYSWVHLFVVSGEWGIHWVSTPDVFSTLNRALGETRVRTESLLPSGTSPWGRECRQVNDNLHPCPWHGNPSPGRGWRKGDSGSGGLLGPSHCSGQGPPCLPIWTVGGWETQITKGSPDSDPHLPELCLLKT